MLRNEKYMGDALLQKTYTVDFMTKKKVKNTGIVPQYYVEDDHEAIIPKAVSYTHLYYFSAFLVVIFRLAIVEVFCRLKAGKNVKVSSCLLYTSLVLRNRILTGF